jgi:hypothetical protein
MEIIAVVVISIVAVMLVAMLVHAAQLRKLGVQREEAHVLRREALEQELRHEREARFTRRQREGVGADRSR